MSRPIHITVDPINASLKDAVSATIGGLPENKSNGKSNNISRSPLRYPGGKTRAVKELIKCFPPNLDRLCSPFVGGGSLEIALADQGVKVFGYDVFEPLISFWQALLKNPNDLAKRVRKYYPLTKSKFYSLQSKYMGIENNDERAAVFFVLNRSSFSGTTLSGGMSPDHPRFTESAIERLEQFNIKNLYIEKADFTQSLKKHQKDFLYLDPPYANGEKLYGNRGDTHEHFDHTGLSTILKKRDGWVLSYNDCEQVRGMYRGHNILIPKWAYGMSNDKKSNEVLILSKDFIQI